MSTDNSSKLKRSIWWPKSVTASKTLTGTDADIAFNNTNATGTITFTLPKASSGTTTTVNGLAFQFILTNLAGNSIVITPITGDTIRGYAASASLTLNAVGQLVELECITAGYWEIVSWGTNSSGPITIYGSASAPALTAVTTSNTQPAIQINESQTNTSGGLVFYDTTTSAVVAGMGIGAVVTGQGVTDLALFSSTNIVLGPGGGNTAAFVFAPGIATFNGSTAGFPLRLNTPSAVTASGIILEQGAGITAELGADGSHTMWSGSANGDFVLRQIAGSIWFVVNSTTLALQITSAGAMVSNYATYLMSSSVAWTAGATGNVPTLTAGPVTGNPTKWIAINDNGTVRHVPAW